MQRRLLKAIWERGAAAAAARSNGASGIHRAPGLSEILSDGRGFSTIARSNGSQVYRPAFFKACRSHFSTTSSQLYRPAVFKVCRSYFSTSGATTAATMAMPLVKGGTEARKKVATWLFVCSGWVFAMVVVGGMTRLTKSGLSMTDWNFTGGLPPLSAEEWEEEFEKYKSYPEYQRVHNWMSLDDFKYIYWMEYAHRMMGRALGAVFIFPGLYFASKGYLTNALLGRFYTLGILGGVQGLIGWWMVKSGLEEPVSQFQEPRVSPYRLATHLTSAFIIYSGVLWTAMSVAFPDRLSVHLPEKVLQASLKVRKMAIPVALLAGLTGVSGAFVAGNDAGRAFNTFPKMGDHWIPPGLLEMNPVWRNIFENTATVQLDHRILAISTLCGIGSLWWIARGLPLMPATSKLLTGAVHMSILQVSLGITALLYYVPVPLGVVHQAGALTLFTILLGLLHTLRRPYTAPTQTSRLMARLK